MKQPIVIEVEPQLKLLAETFRALLDDVRRTVHSSHGGRAVAYSDVEGLIGSRTAAIERAAHAATLSSLDIDVPRVVINGKRFNRLGRSETTFYSSAGEVRVERCTYREAGVRNGKMVDPIALRVGAFDSWLPKAAEGMAHLMQQGTAREAERTGATIGRLAYSASSFDRVGHQVGEAYRGTRADIEDQLTEKMVIPESARSVSVSLDRVSVPMEEERKRPRGRPRKDAPKRFVTRQYRMAWCGTLTLHDADGQSIETIRYGAMPNGNVDRLCGRIAADVALLREKNSELKLVHLADGAPDLWRHLEDHFPSEVFGPRTSLVDFWHVVEKLSAAASLLEGDETTEDRMARWRTRLLRSSKAVDEILVELHASGRDSTRIGESRPVHEAITYLENHRQRMNYAAARRAKLPIGSGNVEATCKSLFAVRMKRAGSRWHDESGEDIVQLRALALSDRWDLAMRELAKRRRTSVRAA